MDISSRRTRIREILGIEPISHGQVYTCQIAIPESEKQDISLERRQLIEDSLTQHKSNLVPLILRRTEAYSEDEDYEVVYGTDWCLVAKELDIEKLWSWVFDMTDEQATVAKEEMQLLLGNITVGEITDRSEIDIGSLIDQKLKPIYSKLNQFVTNYTDIGSLIDQKLKPIISQLNELATNYSQTNVKSDVEEVIRIIQSQLQTLSSAIANLSTGIEPTIPSIINLQKPNLLVAEDEEIREVLENAGVRINNIKAALEAIKYWKQPGRKLSWDNLEKSTKPKGIHKIPNFAHGTYQKLKKVTVI
ncbi:MAG TPA: hypothetical protein VK203_08175 [Nostocaceae cyanobacterium]|nr:hypothetical protein [Nostocaceae cyanobacterium]